MMTCQAFVWQCLAITRMSSASQFPKWMLWRNNARLSLLLQLSCHTGGCAPILTSAWSDYAHHDIRCRLQLAVDIGP